MTYKVHLDGYNNLDHWTGKYDKSARDEVFCTTRPTSSAMRIKAWKIHIGVKKDGIWWNQKYSQCPLHF